MPLEVWDLVLYLLSDQYRGLKIGKKGEEKEIGKAEEKNCPIWKVLLSMKWA